MEAGGHCPYCGESITIVVDPGGAETERYIEDCEVCCRPISVTAHQGDDGEAWVRLDRIDN